MPALENVSDAHNAASCLMSAVTISRTYAQMLGKAGFIRAVSTAPDGVRTMQQFLRAFTVAAEQVMKANHRRLSCPPPPPFSPLTWPSITLINRLSVQP